MSISALRSAVAAASRRLAAEGLLVGTAGNVSMRDAERIAVTGTGIVLADCTPDDVTVVSPSGEVIAGNLVPSSELGLHLGLYGSTDAVAVVHTHAPYSTAIACVLYELPVVHYQQLLLGGTVRVAPFAAFGTPQLAESVRAAIAGRQAALMANHGSVAIGNSLAQATENALLLEWLAALHHRASALGTPHVLTDAQQADVRAQIDRLNYGLPHKRG